MIETAYRGDLLNQDDLCAMIAEQYYQSIYIYCYAKLNYDTNAAQDCTQNVFLVLIQKKHRLDLNGNIRVWLYKTADCVIRNYRRKEKRYREKIPLDEIELADAGGLSDQDAAISFDCLTAAEFALLTDYYNAVYGTRNELAQQHGMTLPELYKEIGRIRNKIKLNK